MVFLGDPTLELFDRDNHRIDFPTENVLGATEFFDHIAKTNSSNDEQINIAFFIRPPAGKRPVDKSESDQMSKRPESGMQDIDQT